MRRGLERAARRVADTWEWVAVLFFHPSPTTIMLTSQYRRLLRELGKSVRAMNLAQVTDSFIIFAPL